MLISLKMCGLTMVSLAGIGFLLSPPARAADPYPCNNSPCVKVSSNGWIVGEIRTFAFGGDSAVLINELAKLGWVECAGQSVKRTDFPDLYKAIGTEWGAADQQNVFYLPDLRGMFLRGWHHGRIAPPKYTSPPYTGDPDWSLRNPPRPEAGDQGGIKGAVQDHVGSVQADQTGPHNHSYSYEQHDRQQQNAYDGGAPRVNTNGLPVTTTTDILHTTESRPVNASVMYFIYVGKAATVVPLAERNAMRGDTGTITPQ